MYCDTWAPAAIVIGMTRGAPPPRSSIACAPAFSMTVSGVKPRSTPSTNTCAPGGSVLTIKVPSLVGGGLGLTYRRAAATPPPARAINATAATASRQDLLAGGEGSSLPSGDDSSVAGTHTGSFHAGLGAAAGGST